MWVLDEKGKIGLDAVFFIISLREDPVIQYPG